MVGLDFKLLGPLQVLRDGTQLDIGSRKQRALLALLLVNRRQIVSSDIIVMALWGADAPEARRNDVYVYMSRLRKALGGEPGEATPLLRREAGGYAIDIAESDVDAGRFMGMLAEARRLHESDPTAASLVLSDALALWEGDALQEFAADDFAAPAIKGLEEAYLAAIELRIRCDMAWKDTDELIPEIKALVSRFPLRPELTASLMMALYRRGRQADALQAYQRLANALGEELGIEPPQELQRLEEHILLDRDVSTEGAVPMVRNGMPEPIAAFVGRDEELADLSRLVEAHRLVTITGAGGLGKTSLAVEFGRRVALRYEDAVLVDLTLVEATGDVFGALAAELRCVLDGQDAADAVVARLGKRRVLVILDNCEPVRSEAAHAAVQLLQRAPGLRILATSRVVLGVDGESVYRLAPLDVNDGGDAQRLLADRIQLVGRDGAGNLVDGELDKLAEGTAGFPLLIELAAAQLRTFSAAEVIAAMDEPLTAFVSSERIGPERHRDLRANIGWSERLLSPESAALLRRMAIFRSSFALAAVAPVAGFAPLETGDVRTELRRLVDASLVVVDRGSSTRFRMLEPVRQYAWGRLEEEGEVGVVADRHSGYFAELFAGSRVEVEAGKGIDVLDSDAANLEAAMRHLLKIGEVEGAQRMAAEAMWFWDAAESSRAVLPLIEQVLAADTTPSKPRARLLHLASPRIALVRGRDWMYGAMLDELRTTAGALRDPAVDAWVLRREADAVPAAASWGELIAAHEAAIAASMDTGQPVEALMSLHNYAWALSSHAANSRDSAARADCLDAAEAVVDRYAELAETMGFVRDVVIADMVRAWIALSRGQHQLAERLSAHAADGMRSLGEHRRAATMSQPLALSAFAQGDPGRTLRHLHTAIDALDDLGMLVFAADWRFFRALVLVDLGRIDEAVAELVQACALVGSLVDSDLSKGALPLLGRALIPIDAEMAVVALACGEQHRGARPWPVLRDWDARNNDPLKTLRDGLDPVVFATAAERGFAMKPPAVYAESATRLAGLMPAGSSHSPGTG
ncbi:MAG TPA: BTAD domain-containing putative transcriptional regulator [Acidimicrobiia bacterium]|jgi:predicted ATPase|nr:BTAD domain-containing putative transcriptional regulator [Acidimicrobiia bacterium]